MLAVVISLSLLWSLVNSLTYSYVSFRGKTLANHSCLDFSLVGPLKTGSDSVQCHTDLTTCCTGGQGIHRGDWYFPNGTRLQFSRAGVLFSLFTLFISVLMAAQSSFVQVEPPNNKHIGTRYFVLYREVCLSVSFIRSILYRRFYCI